MKFSKPLIILLAAGLFATVLGCSTTSITNKKKSQKTNPENNWTLKNHLQRTSKARITGSPGSERVIIRGVSSTNSPTSQPLFVIDGQKAGHSFARVNEMLYPGEINYIEVLPPSQSARYGMEGHFGVIRIFTKNQ
ncbi:TonB-dependent receptor [Fodinibius sp.]|uniref:TonB-dependent receptor n=1 Tax=Fodinibius sp. TaxID=1872440 RepID=UPI002ACE6E68|nr:TonB-dependent receptor plug domain-containing protein [Fodinibius sp.]MDZ7659050.1 TonB-dependent receptor plug domain-containing protein [Fodinibius sp.]